MRIGILTATFLPKIGGTERSVDRLARHFTARGHQVVVVTHDRNGEPDVDYPVFLFKRPKFRGKWPGVFARPIKQAWRKHQFDALLCMNANPTAYGALWARRLGASFAIVSCPRGVDLYPSLLKQRSGYYRHLTRYAYRKSDRIIAISSFMRSQLEAFVGPPLPPIDSVYTGIDLSEQAELAQRAAEAAEIDQVRIVKTFPQLALGKFILHMARICDYKQQDIAIEALVQQAQALRAAQVRYVMAGDGPMFDEIGDGVRRAGLEDVVIMPGMVGEPDRTWLLNHALFFVSTSREEGMPNAVLEAIAQGCAVLVTDIAPHHDILDGRSCGRFCKVNDAKELGERLVEMLDADLPTMGQAAHAAARDFTIEAMVDGYERSLAAAIRDRAGGSGPTR